MSAASVVSFNDARRIVEEHAAKVLASRSNPAETEITDILAARGRVLSEPILADRDFPPFNRATRDGYAVRAADVEKVPARLEVIGEIKAGEAGDPASLNPGQAASIMTGAPLPIGADAVVMVEYTAVFGNWVEIQRSVASGENFVTRGAEAQAEQLLIDKGRRLDHSLIAIAAAVGKGRVRVFRKPRIAVLATGDELVEIGAVPGKAEIRNSNSYSLAAQIEDAGGEPVRLAIAPDEPKRLRELMEEGMACDLLLMTGGVSMGKYDLVEQVLAELKAELYFTGARIQPGKPVVFGSCESGTCAKAREDSTYPTVTRTGVSASHASMPRYFFGLPGNPVSTMVTFRLFAQPMIAALAGARPEPLLFLQARLKAAVKTKTGLTRFLPAVLSGAFENSEVELANWKGSGDIAALAGADCFLVIPPDREQIEAGERVSVLMA
ncbi:MAG: molybdopterin molybdotransferase MoeA [Terriglobales bacterium]